ncbi:MAG: hypothetical protein IRZ17_19045 [Mycolicibacterium hassiacum]|uniref:hypothetical protein n=1 Tax=Mycolicibacterium hassiacum TaxID=46351 RepID=UPI0023F798E9|nr:hypothetical protein [Mycolicibacterium hassiacum]MBX5488695.1 hypothetical protein [Mycolicibacterium hassiacum]
MIQAGFQDAGNFSAVPTERNPGIDGHICVAFVVGELDESLITATVLPLPGENNLAPNAAHGVASWYKISSFGDTSISPKSGLSASRQLHFTDSALAARCTESRTISLSGAPDLGTTVADDPA